jgi:hypothetical protein
MCGCVGAFAACSLFPGVTGAKMIDLLPPSDPADGKTFRVICLHDVRDNLMASFSSASAMVDPFAVDTGTLTAIFSWLQTNNYHTITVRQIEESRRGGKPLPPRAVLLTFDDGYRSHYTKVLPLLERFQYPAVMGIVTAWIDAPPDLPIRISDKVQVPRDYFMSWDEVKQIGQSHLVELGCHTTTFITARSRTRKATSCRRPRRICISKTSAMKPTPSSKHACTTTCKPACGRSASAPASSRARWCGRTVRKTSPCAGYRHRSAWTSSSASMPARTRPTCRWTG